MTDIVRKYARTILDAFKASEATGARSRDRQFAIELLEKAFADPAIEILERLHKSATEKLRDTSHLLSNPPKNSAIWDIRNEIQREIDRLRKENTC